MLNRIRRMPSPALVISIIALIVAVGGGTYAIALNKHDTKKIVNKQIKKKAPKLTDLTSTWSPIPDEYGFVIRSVFLAKAYDYMGSGRSELEQQKSDRAIIKALAREDAENDEEYIVPSEPLMGPLTDLG